MNDGTLSRFGLEFQLKCLIALINDKSFLEQSLEVLQPVFFESEANQWIAKTAMEYYSQYKSLPTTVVFARERDRLPLDSNLRDPIKESFKLMRTYEHDDDLSYVKAQFIEFCKNQALAAAILKSADMLNSGRYDQIKLLIDKAMNAGAERNLGHNYLTDMEKRFSKEARNVVPTPWKAINDIMNGGLGAGELGCVIAASGGGKSWILNAIGAHATKIGKNVVNFTFELNENYLGCRYDSIYTGIDSMTVQNYPDKVKAAMAELTGQLNIKFYPARSVNVNALRAHINRLISIDMRPDLVLIDYADLMLSVAKGSARHEELQYLHEEIRGMLGELQIPGWTASQSQRSSTQDEIIEADKIAGSYGKIMTDDFVMSSSRLQADKISDTGRIHIIKNRFGPDGQTFPAIMKFSEGVIGIYDETSPEYARIKAQMASGEGQIKALMNKKLKSFIDHKRAPDDTSSASTAA